MCLKSPIRRISLSPLTGGAREDPFSQKQLRRAYKGLTPFAALRAHLAGVISIPTAV